MLTDSTPDEEEEVGAVKTPAQEDEADPPEPFEWTPPGHPDHPDYVATEAVEGSTDADTSDVAANNGNGDAAQE
jgi:26S proteasome regulatory subunit N2